MDDILELASRLGRRIADEPRAKRMVAARAALDASLVDRRLLSEFEDVQGRLYELESSGKPIEPEDKRRFVELQQKVIQSSVIEDLLKAQADFLELMTLVSQRIEVEAQGPDTPPPT